VEAPASVVEEEAAKHGCGGGVLDGVEEVWAWAVAVGGGAGVE
jgi:hypothetical protein